MNRLGLSTVLLLFAPLAIAGDGLERDFKTEPSYRVVDSPKTSRWLRETTSVRSLAKPGELVDIYSTSRQLVLCQRAKLIAYDPTTETAKFRLDPRDAGRLVEAVQEKEWLLIEVAAPK